MTKTTTKTTKPAEPKGPTPIDHLQALANGINELMRMASLPQAAGALGQQLAGHIDAIEAALKKDA